MSVSIGTSGFNYKSWKGKFYPEDLSQKKWLEFYSQEFETVEINNSFYVSVRDKTYENWESVTPKNFKFTIKGHRFITHRKRLNDVEESVEFFFQSAFHLKRKLDIVLWQFPASFICTDETFKRLKVFLSLLPITTRQAFEFRHKSWFQNDVFDVISKQNAGFVVNDTPRFSSITYPVGSFAYIRFHGPGALYASSYSDKELAVWSEKIKEYKKKCDVYCYFNNDMSGYAIDNARTLRRLVSE